VERIAVTLCARTTDAAEIVEPDDLDDADERAARPDRDFRDLCLDSDALRTRDPRAARPGGGDPCRPARRYGR